MKSLLKTDLIDNRKKNTKRAFPKGVKEEVMKRDEGCIVCGDSNTLHFHHVLYGSEKVYTESCNDSDQIVWLCNSCHHKCHFEASNGIRGFCKSYLHL